MAQVGDAATHNEKEVKTRYPVVSGLELIDKHEGRQMNLVPERGSFVALRTKVGL